MKILLFVKDFAVGKEFSKNGLPTKSGAEFHAENHARQLIERGHEVSIFAKKRYFFTKGRENLSGIDLIRLHPPFRWLEILLRLATTHGNFDAIYIIGTPKFAVWAVLFALLSGRPVTLALTGKAEIFDGGSGWRNRIFRKCTNYIATTHEIREGFMSQGMIPAERVTVLPHGINTALYPHWNCDTKRKQRERHGIAADAKVLLFCARVVINKGIDTVQKLWPIVHGGEPSSVLLIVGGGRNELMEELKNFSTAHGNSVIVTGEVPLPQEYYQMSDVYVFPSRHEGLPTSLIEAMSSGLPAVASDIGGCDDLIFDGETGFRVPSEDFRGFAEKISYLFTHEEERCRMGDSAADFVREKCDYAAVIPPLANIIASREPVSEDYLARGCNEFYDK